ncbi:MAG: MFS transporter [Alphaproteobacteria bacterium]|nr:MFS transporter [Alphaproteobacteria bacterium]
MYEAATLPKRRLALAALSFSMLLPSLGTSIANVALPALSTAFDASFQEVRWVVLSYLVSITALIVGAGRLGDLMGRRRLLLAGVALFTVASAASGTAQTLWLLIAARAVQGLGAAIMMAHTVALVSEIVPTERTGAAMGLLGAMSAVGTALGPALGGFLISAFGWPAIFHVNVPLGLVAFLIAWRSLPRTPPAQAGTRFDVSGTLLLAIGLAAYALAMTTGRGGFGAINIALLAAASLVLLLFFAVEKTAAAPLIRLALFRNVTLGAGFAMSLLVSSVIMATLVVGPFYLSGALDLAPASVGLVLSVGPVTAALTGIPAGRLADRVGATRMTTMGLTAMALGSSALALIPPTGGIPGYMLPTIVITAGYAIFQTANNTSVMGEATSDQRGMISGMLNLSRYLGLITGTSALGAVFAFAGSIQGASSSAAAVTAGMRATFAVGSIFIAAALLVDLITRGGRGRSPGPRA